MRWKPSAMCLIKGRMNMKLYKEMLRKLGVIGLPLMAVVVLYTLIRGGSDCFGQYYILEPTSAVSQVFALRFYVFSGALFALYGFSFQFSRAGSDVYHSLPVKRSEMYMAVLLATMTWMGATIVLSELEMLLIYLVSGCPFVPVYIPLSILYYFVASMIVFAATALGCALSGTFITAVASTGIILLLPRLTQFFFARGIVERVPIIGWLDLGPWLDPSTNAATGILAMMVRNVFNGRLITLPHILYSLIPMLIMLGAGYLLHARRPSEFAHRNGGYRGWSIAIGVMLAFTVLLPITMNNQKLLSVYGALLLAGALGVYVVYQLLASNTLKKALTTLPYFAIAVVAIIGFTTLVDSSADTMRDTVPVASEIASVEFPGYDRVSGAPNYTTLLTQDISFTDEETKAYVSENLAEAVAKLQPDASFDYYSYNSLEVVEPVIIHLAGGGTLRRTIKFDDINELNRLRSKNSDFSQAVQDFPPLESVQYLWAAADFTPQETRAILESYIAESKENGIIGGYYYRTRKVDMFNTGDYLAQGSQQVIGGMYAAGHVGSQRYNDSYSIRLETPKTAGLVMQIFNTNAPDNSVEKMRESLQQFGESVQNDDESLNLDLSVYNYRDANGHVAQNNVSFYKNRYTMDSEYAFETLQLEYMPLFADALVNTEVTDDPTGVFIGLNWRYRSGDPEVDNKENDVSTVFLRFIDEESEQAFLTLMDEWNEAQEQIMGPTLN